MFAKTGKPSFLGGTGSRPSASISKLCPAPIAFGCRGVYDRRARSAPSMVAVDRRAMGSLVCANQERACDHIPRSQTPFRVDRSLRRIRRHARIAMRRRLIPRQVARTSRRKIPRRAMPRRHTRIRRRRIRIRRVLQVRIPTHQRQAQRPHHDRRAHHHPHAPQPRCSYRFHTKRRRITHASALLALLLHTSAASPIPLAKCDIPACKKMRSGSLCPREIIAVRAGDADRIRFRPSARRNSPSDIWSWGVFRPLAAIPQGTGA